MPSLFKDITVTMITRGLIFPIAIGTGIILARVLGPAMIGSYRIFVLIYSVVTLFVLFGLGSANVYHGAKNHDVLPALAGNSIIAGLLLGSIGASAILSLSIWPEFQRYLVDNGLSLNDLRLFVWILPVSLSTAYLQEIIRASGDITQYNFVSLLKSSILLVSVLVGVWLLDYGLAGAIGAWLLAELLCGVWTLLRVLSITGYRLSINWGLFRRCLKFGIHLYPGNIMQFLNYRLDVFLVGFYLPSAFVGYYTTAGGLSEKLWEFPNAISTSLLHRVSGATQSAEIHLTTARITRLLSLMMGIACILLALLSRQIVTVLYGADYLPAVPAVIALMPGIWALSIGKIMAIHMSGSGRPEVGTWGAMLSLFFTVVLDLLLIPKFGILGAAITSSVAYTISTLFILTVFVRFTRISFLSLLLPRVSDLVLVSEVTYSFIWRGSSILRHHVFHQRSA